ncbi:MAG: HPr(Ser) kinase/phosphatase [Chitinivibrionales bacterium]|nr:HPr(Ser) kinase/phosphatase [Chitinivibrionales bacterium]
MSLASSAPALPEPAPLSEFFEALKAHWRSVVGDPLHSEKPLVGARVVSALPVLAGLETDTAQGALLLWGNHAAHFFADRVSQDAALAALRPFISRQASAIIFTDGIHPPPALAALLKTHHVPGLMTECRYDDIRRQAEDFLFERLAPRQVIHGTLLCVHGCGLLLTGRSGIGKSESALDLIERGHQLVADDAVQIYRRGGAVIGSTNPTLAHHLEVRGIGIVDIVALFGARAVRFSQRIDAIVQLVPWSPKDSYERIGLSEVKISLAGLQLPQITIPLSSGRTVASFIEVIALTTLQHQRGINSADALNRKLISTMQMQSNRRAGASLNRPHKKTARERNSP